jgi:hypothetical protein
MAGDGKKNAERELMTIKQVRIFSFNVLVNTGICT